MYSNREGIQFSYKDTYDIHEALRPIIASALKRFIEVREQKKELVGTPGRFILEAQETGLTEEEAHEEWNRTLQFIYEAFATQPPDIADYDFSQSLVFGEPNEEGLSEVNVVLDYGAEERERLYRDEGEYYKKRNKGYELFGKYLQYLWW